jgi:hypothetical protein
VHTAPNRCPNGGANAFANNHFANSVALGRPYRITNRLAIVVTDSWPYTVAFCEPQRFSYSLAERQPDSVSNHRSVGHAHCKPDIFTYFHVAHYVTDAFAHVISDRLTNPLADNDKPYAWTHRRAHRRPKHRAYNAPNAKVPRACE